jgi:hypothetical protein
MVNADSDQGQAAREADARERLLGIGAARLPRPPWRHARQPPSATELIQFALWRAGTGKIGDDDLAAALALLPAARSEVDQTEAAVLFTARAQGLSWSQISRAMGLGSAQAAQQRFDRISGRVEHPA